MQLEAVRKGAPGAFSARLGERTRPADTDGAVTPREALRENVDVLWPIQLGVSVASADGEIRGAHSPKKHVRV